MKNINRKFGLITGGAFLAIAGYKFIFHHSYFVICVCIGSFLLLAAVIAPIILNPLRIAWDKLGAVLGFINTHIILFLVFFLLVTPIGFILKLRNKNLLGVKKTKNNNTHWQPVTIAEQNSLKQQF